MAKRLLLTRSRHDIGNQYLYAYSEEILDDAENLGWKADNVEDGRNRRPEIESRLEKTKPDFVFFNGHGSDRSICGHLNETLVDVESAPLLSGKIVYARSCSALKVLGRAAVEKGCRAFIGYNGFFFVPSTNEFAAAPGKDPVAKPVLEVSNLVGKLILKGDSVGVAVDSAQRKAGDLILKMLASEEPYDGATFRALYQNFITLSFEGDPKARVE